MRPVRNSRYRTRQGCNIPIGIVLRGELAIAENHSADEYPDQKETHAQRGRNQEERHGKTSHLRAARPKKAKRGDRHNRRRTPYARVGTPCLIYVYRRSGVPDFSRFGPLSRHELTIGGSAGGASLTGTRAPISVPATEIGLCDFPNRNKSPRPFSSVRTTNWADFQASAENLQKY
jgi:hypothetical protein